MPKTTLYDQDAPENRDPAPVRGPISAHELLLAEGIDVTVCWCGCGEPAGRHCSGCGRTLQ